MIKCGDNNEYRFLIRKSLEVPPPDKKELRKAGELMREASKDIEELSVTTAVFNIMKSK